MKVGAKGKFHDWLTADGLLMLEAWARDGLTHEQIAHNMGISRETLNIWRKKYIVISDALKTGKLVVDIQVENALFKRAMGYTFTEVTRERVPVHDEETGEITGSEMCVTKEVVKEVQPDVTAQIFWLKNRKPDVWRDRKDLDMNATFKNPFEGLTAKELRGLIKDG